MSDKLQTQKKEVPSIYQYFEDGNLRIEKDKVMVFLNQQPPAAWIKKNPYANNASYLPIDKVEWMLNRFFGGYRVEILREGTMFNAMYVVIRLFYIDPITGKETYQDGMGSKEVQTKKGSSPAQLENINSGAVERGLPNAESNAIKDASHKIGRIFGADLNRKEILPVGENQDLKDVQKQKEDERLIRLIESSKTLDELAKYFDHIDQDNEELMNVYNEKAKILRK